MSALWINSLARRPEIKADAAIGIITTASFALGVALISRARSYTPSVEAMLFGNILGVDRTDLLVVAAVLVASTILLLVYYRPLLFHTFDSEVAQVQGVPTGRVSIVFAFLLAAVIISSMQVLGVTLISAVLIMPATIARMLTVSFQSHDGDSRSCWVRCRRDWASMSASTSTLLLEHPSFFSKQQSF